MKMTREQLYRRIEQAESGEIAALEAKIAVCPWRQSYHIQPVTGLLNDPNGFSFYEGYYHLFYQWFPLGTEHGMKYWYHTRSTNLANWENVGIAIEPEVLTTHMGVFRKRNGERWQVKPDLHRQYPE